MRGREVPLQLRVAVITLRFFVPSLTFLEISKKLELEQRTCQRIWQTTVERASDRESFRDLIACVATQDRPGRPPRIEDGSTESHRIRQLILNNDEIQWSEIAHIYQQESGVRLHRSLIERIAKHDDDPERPFHIVRGVRPLVPTLSSTHMNERLLFSIWALRKLQNGAIFIFTDETLVEVGGDPRKKPKISRPKGQKDERWERAQPRQKVQFNFMVWCAVCVGWNGHFPLKFWTDETEQEKVKAIQHLTDENLDRRQEVNLKRKRALTELESTEHRVLQDITNRVNNENERRRQTHQRGRLRPKPVEKIFPYNDLSRGDREKNGVDWYRHRQGVLRPLLYPFYFQVQAKFPDREVWIVEDNASPHKKAAENEVEYRRRWGIRTVQCPGGPGWPSKSPDLNMIEASWNDLKNDSHPRFWGLHGDSKRTRQQAHAIVLQEWRTPKVRNAAIDHCNRFAKRLLQTIGAKGNNTFRH